MSVPLMSSLSLQQICDGFGRPIVGAKIYFFDAGTTTPRPVYVNPARSIAHPFPVLTDASGRVPPVYFGEGYYRVQITDDSGAFISDFDQVQGYVPTPSTDTGAATPSTAIPTGFLLASVGDAVLSDKGWVRANGRTLGGASSGAAEYGAADAFPLFSILWNYANLDVLGGRGASARADFDAGKTVQLPDFRGCTLVGRDGMGNALSGRLTSTVFGSPDLATAGGGASKTTLSVDHLPSHGHAFTTGEAGGHSHANSITDLQGLHYHTTPFHNFTSGPVAAGSGATALISGVTTADATQSAGAHGHSLEILPDGVHSHAGATAAVGGGVAIDLFQPSRQVTFYLKL